MRKWLAIFIVAVGCAAGNVQAQEAALSRLYGQGVHAYFRGDLPAAEKLFTQTINAGSQDPRAHYFRGLIYLQYGRDKAAETDFEEGAALETGATRDYAVSMALERIQGRMRLTLEKHRAARLAAGTTATQMQRRQRMDSIRGRETETTVPPRPNTLDEITGDAAPVPAGAPEVSEPFEDPAEAPAPLVPPADDEVPMDEASPFGEDEAMPADVEPSEPDPTTPVPPVTPPTTTPDEGDTSPFGDDEETPLPPDTTPTPDDTAPTDDTTPADETEDPFGGEDDTAPPTEGSTPPGETPPADSDDPFAG